MAFDTQGSSCERVLETEGLGCAAGGYVLSFAKLSFYIVTNNLLVISSAILSLYSVASTYCVLPSLLGDG